MSWICSDAADLDFLTIAEGMLCFYGSTEVTSKVFFFQGSFYILLEQDSYALGTRY